MAAHFCTGARCAVILGDNVFVDPLGPLLAEANTDADRAWVALKSVPDPGRYGVAELQGNRIVGIEEKPAQPKSDYAVAGIYVYPPDVFDVIKGLRRAAAASWRSPTSTSTTWHRDGSASVSSRAIGPTPAPTIRWPTSTSSVRDEAPRF